MNECKPLLPGMLPNPIELRIDDESVDFTQAKEAAEQAAKSKTNSPMLLAWFNSLTGRFSPDVICCGETKPTWLVYAESRGADLSVSVNNGDFVFVFMSLPE